MADNNCTGTYGPKHPDSTTDTQSACTTRPGTGEYCPTQKTDKTCGDFQLTKLRDSCFIDNLTNESLNIGGADFHVYKLLGVHEQGKTVDVTGHGHPLSNGDAPGFPATNAFDKYVSEWRSIQKGDGVISSAYIGYDFGEILTNDGTRRKYSIDDANIRKHITALAIKQSSDKNKRVTRARIERSDDGKKWYGVAVVNLPDDDCFNTILFKHSVSMRYWRIRPVAFNGTSQDYWGIQTLQLFDNYVATNEDNIQDKIFLENRDRDYAADAELIKGSYDLIDVTSELSKFGIEVPSQSLYMTVSFSACVAKLNRPLIIGDIVEIPSEAQYTPDMKRIEKWMEVTDVAWSTEGYTPGWQPTLQRIILQPAYASQETQDIFGDLAETPLAEQLGLVKGGDGNNPKYQDYSDVTQEIRSQSSTMVPQSGADGSSTIREFEDDNIQAGDTAGINIRPLGLNSTGLYVEDAMPPNNAPFTEGTEFPDSPAHGDYHRMTYDGMASDVPARLYRWSAQKNRWIYLETDRRHEFDSDKPKLEEFLKGK